MASAPPCLKPALASLASAAGGRPKAALVLGNYRTTLTTLRELSKLGFRCILAVEPGITFAESSRYVDEIWRAPPLNSPKGAFLEALLDLIERTPDLDLIMPITEPALNAVARIKTDLKNRVRLALPPLELIAICHDKHAWLQFLERAGIEVPAFAVATTLAELKTKIREIGTPVVIRPTEAGKRIGQKKAVTLHNEQDFAQAFPTWPADLSQLLIQRRFIGERHNIYFGASKGQIIRQQHSKSLRTDRADGTGQTVEGITIAPVPLLSQDLAAVVKAMNYTGVGNAQFLYDPASDKSCFLEINPRFGASYAFVEKIGMALTQLAVELASSDRALITDIPYGADAGTRFVYSYNDLGGLLYSLNKGDIGPRGALAWCGAILRAFVRADVHVSWSWDDPKPALLNYARCFLGRKK